MHRSAASDAYRDEEAAVGKGTSCCCTVCWPMEAGAAFIFFNGPLGSLNRTYTAASIAAAAVRVNGALHAQEQYV